MKKPMLAYATLPSLASRPVRERRRAPQLHGWALALYDGIIGGPRGARASAGQKNTAFQTKRSMTDAGQGIEGVLLANRDRIVRFLQLRGAGDAAEDLFQDLWMRLTGRRTGPIADPLSYVMRAANNLMLDRYRSTQRSDLRDKAWGEAAAVPRPSAETALISREQLMLTEQAIVATGERPALVFRRFRIDGISQREIAGEMGVSLSTVEADLRKVYAALALIRRQFDAN
jgi:RNA polymerase sigma-70 factor (ECF subfamily)